MSPAKGLWKPDVLGAARMGIREIGIVWTRGRASVKRGELRASPRASSPAGPQRTWARPVLLAATLVCACALAWEWLPGVAGWPLGGAGPVIRLVMQFGAIMAVMIGAIPRDRAYAFAAANKIGRARAQVARRLIEGAGARAWDEVRAGSHSEVGLGWLRYKLIGWELVHVGRMTGALRVLLASFAAFGLAIGVNSRLAPPDQASGLVYGPLAGLLFVACFFAWAFAGPLWRLSLASTCDGRRMRGQCPHCGYDLRGVIPQQSAGTIVVGPERCSECGCPWPLVPSERDQPVGGTIP